MPATIYLRRHMSMRRRPILREGWESSSGVAGRGRRKRRASCDLGAERLEGRVLLANQFLAAPDYPTGAGPEAAAIGEFTGDGRRDIVTANSDGGTVSVLPGHGDGTFG